MQDITASFQPQNVATTATIGAQGSASMWSWIVGWSIMLVVMWGINKTRIGHTIIYYSLCMMILFTLLTQYQQVNSYLGIFGSASAGERSLAAEKQAPVQTA